MTFSENILKFVSAVAKDVKTIKDKLMNSMALKVYTANLSMYTTKPTNELELLIFLQKVDPSIKEVDKHMVYKIFLEEDGNIQKIIEITNINNTLIFAVSDTY